MSGGIYKENGVLVISLFQRAKNIMNELKECAYSKCNNLFEKTVKNRRFCSKNCCDKEWRKNSFAIPRKCQCCGEEFIRTATHQRYCSTDCRKADYKENPPKRQPNWKKPDLDDPADNFLYGSIDKHHGDS